MLKFSKGHKSKKKKKFRFFFSKVNWVIYFVYLIVLRFYGPVNPMASCRAQSVYLTTLLLGRFCPLSG